MIVQRSRNEFHEDVSIEDISSLIKCSLILFQAYIANFKLNPNLIQKLFKQPFEDAKVLFKKLISILIPDLSGVVLQTILELLEAEKLWKIESICCEIFQSLLACGFSSGMLFSRILSSIDDMTYHGNAKEITHGISVLYSILKAGFFSKVKAFHLVPLVIMYCESLNPKNKRYYAFRRGFELCLRKICENMDQKELVKLITGKTLKEKRMRFEFKCSCSNFNFQEQ